MTDQHRIVEVLDARLQTRQNLGTRYPFEIEKVKGSDGYWLAMLKHWTAEDDLIFIEQDMVVHTDHIENFLGCEYPFCTIPYRLPNGHWSLFNPQQSLLRFHNRNGETNLDVTLEPIDHIVRYSPGSALGLVRFTRAAQRMLDISGYPLTDKHWSMIDAWISHFMKEILLMNWHVHYPAVHQIHR